MDKGTWHFKLNLGLKWAWQNLYKPKSQAYCMAKCTSCKKETHDCVKFKCPKCKEDLYRCSKCRTLSIEYLCACGFKGP